MIKNLDEKIRAYTLKNAISYGGKANAGSVVSSLFNEGLEKKDVKEVMPKIQKTIDEISKLNSEKQKNEFEKLKKFVSERSSREGLPELPNAENGVVMRFRPAPSGPLHVGHIISNLASSMYVKKYGGKFYIVIDDTSPESTLKDAYDKIKQDCDWIFGNVTEYLNASDRMKIYYKYANELIKKSQAYICTCSGDEFRKFSNEQKNCPCRKKSVEENLSDWKKMENENGFKEGEAVLRFKSSMNEPNPAMRDFPLARIVEKEHPLQGNKYRIWPLMNLVVAVDDMELGMTHVIRGKDHRDNAERQKIIFKIFDKKYPWTFFIGRLKFKDVELSKRKITAAIKEGKYSGYDDESLPTIASLKKRGYKPEAFEKFIEERGLTEVDKVISQKDFFDVINRLNKEQ